MDDIYPSLKPVNAATLRAMRDAARRLKVDGVLGDPDDRTIILAVCDEVKQAEGETITPTQWRVICDAYDEAKNPRRPEWIYG